MSLLSKYQIKASRRSRGVRVTVHRDGRVVVTKPLAASDARVEHFLRVQEPWIEAKVAEFMQKPIVRFDRSRADYLARKEAARAVALERLAYFKEHYGLSWSGVSIKAQTTRWGSCSAKKHISFNYHILDLTPEERDYVIVHELCHLAEMNHGRGFWKLVEETIPEHRSIRDSLKKYVL